MEEVVKNQSYMYTLKFLPGMGHHSVMHLIGNVFSVLFEPEVTAGKMKIFFGSFSPYMEGVFEPSLIFETLS